MAEIETSVLRIGSNDLVLQDSAVRGSLAAAYSASSTYAVGDMVLKDGQLYECNTAISTAEAWTAAHWTAVTVGGELATVKDGLSAVETQLEQTTADALSAYATDTASGAIASFPDGADGVPVKSLTVDIEPVQDLHGQDAPYPAGGGKNLLDFRTKAAGSDNGVTYTNNNGVITANGTASGYSYYQSPTQTLPAGTYIVNGRPSGSSCALTIYNATTSSGIANPSAGGSQTFTLSEATPVYARILIGSGTANNEVFKPMIRLSSVTDATFAPYENICPISGHTSAVVTRTGKNLFDKDAVTVGKWLSVTTGLEEASANYSVTDFIPVEANKTIFMPTSGTSRRWFYDSNKNPKTYLGNPFVNAFTPTENGFVRVTLLTIGSGSIDINDYQIEFGSTATAYESYNGQTVTIDLDGTRYGGTLDVTTGVLTVDRALITLDGSNDENWAASGSKFYSTTMLDTKSNAQAICNQYKYSGISSGGSSTVLIDKSFYLQPANNRIWVYDTGHSDLTSFKTALGNNPLVVAYEIATPTTVQLTAQDDITTLKGQNNIWADTGDDEVEYRADTKLYINKVLNA